MDKIQEIYESYDNVVQKIGSDAVRSYYADLFQMYEDFIKQEGLVDKIKVNSFVLIHALMDCFTDITRLKDFHKIENVNLYKFVAYEMSWLLRRKPLQILQDEEEKLVYINEKFVLSFVINFLTQKEKYLNMGDLERKAFDGFIESLYYHLKYRDCSAQVLELVLLSFEAGLKFNSNLN